MVPCCCEPSLEQEHTLHHTRCTTRGRTMHGRTMHGCTTHGCTTHGRTTHGCTSHAGPCTLGHTWLCRERCTTHTAPGAGAPCALVPCSLHRVPGTTHGCVVPSVPGKGTGSLLRSSRTSGAGVGADVHPAQSAMSECPRRGCDRCCGSQVCGHRELSPLFLCPWEVARKEQGTAPCRLGASCTLGAERISRL